MPVPLWVEVVENPVYKGDFDFAREDPAGEEKVAKGECAREDPAEEEEKVVLLSAPRVLMPAMNFLSNSCSMAVRLPSGVERLAERRSMLDKKL